MSRSTMFSFFKSQVIKPFLKFTKNLSADQINLSVLKGEGELKSLELDDTTLMELLDLPTWLCLRKAHCSGISFKIRWTKLETHPIFVVIDRVDVELEALDEPRPVTESMFASYRTGSGKYRLPDRVVDGATVLVNSVFIYFYAQAFKASIELSRLTVMSKTPQWQNGALNLTSLMFPAGDAVLIFKEISWDSVRIAADGLLSELNGIPVKLISNTGRIRLTLKKRLSDSALISTRIQLILDDLLWVLTLSQVEAAIVFLRSLKHSVLLAAHQRRQYAESRAERQTLGWKTNIISGPIQTTPSKHDKVAHVDQYSWAARIFHQHDVLETSYHFCVFRTEIHFCDETRQGTQMSQVVVPNGYIKIHFQNLELDWYPYHVEPSPQVRWRGSTNFREARDNWLAGVNRAHLPPARRDQARYPPADPLLNGPARLTTDFAPVSSIVRVSVIQSVLVLRIRDFDVSRVSFPDSCGSGLKASGPSVTNNALQYRGEELPSATHLFLASDKKLHCLPENSNVLTVELRTTYRSRGRKISQAVGTPVLPCILFAQFQPFHLRFDTDTVIWLNAFLLTLHVNLSAFAQLRGNESVLDADYEANNRDQNPSLLHIRCEALMPRIILPLPDTKQTVVGAPSVCDIHSGPDALVVQFDEVIIELLTPPLNSTAASVLKRLLAKQAVSDVVDELATDKGKHEAKTHIRVNLDRFANLAASATSSESPNIKGQYWCIHCPHLWAQFLTVVEVLDDDISKKRNTLKRTSLSLYRQSILEPIPLTVWVSLRFPSPSVPIDPVQPGMQLIIDVDCSVNPLDTGRRGFAGHLNQAEPISLFLGVIPPANGRLCLLPTRNRRLPDALDQLLFLCNLANQLSRVKDQLGLDLNRISGMLNNPEQTFCPSTPRLLYTLKFVIQRRLQLNLVSPWSGDTSSRLGHKSCSAMDELHLSKPHYDDQSYIRGQSPETPEKSDRDFTESPFLAVRETPQSRTQISDSINLKHKNNSFFALMAKNSQVDNLSTKSSSTSDITSVTDDYGEKEGGTQNNWLSTYVVLFSSEDVLKDPDSSSVCSSGGFSCSHRFDYQKSSPQEVGTELFETESLRSSLDMNTIDADPLKLASGRSSRLSESSFDDRGQCETNCRAESVKESPFPMTIMLLLDGIVGEADGTDTEMRIWLKVGPVSLTYKLGNPDYSNQESMISEVSGLSTSRAFSWSVFVSVIRQLTNKPQADVNEVGETSYRTSVCLHADLLKSCSFYVPKVVLQTAQRLLRSFNSRGGLDQLQSMLPTGTLLREMHAPLTTMDISLHLKRGFLTVEMGSVNADETGELIRKIHLQQGLSLVLDKSAILRVGLAENISQKVHLVQPKEVATELCEIFADAPHTTMGSNTLLSRYLAESAQLEENMNRLNATVGELKAVLACMEHLLSTMRQH